MRIFDRLREFDFAPRQLKCNSGGSVGGGSGSSSYSGSSSSSLTSSILGAVSQTAQTGILSAPNLTNPVTPINQAPVQASGVPASSSFSTILIVLVLVVLGYFAFTKL
jgi:hypothetical protein